MAVTEEKWALFWEDTEEKSKVFWTVSERTWTQKIGNIGETASEHWLSGKMKKGRPERELLWKERK